MAPKWGLFDFLKNFVISFSWILVLELWAELLLAYQIAGFFKIEIS